VCTGPTFLFKTVWQVLSFVFMSVPTLWSIAILAMGAPLVHALLLAPQTFLCLLPMVALFLTMNNVLNVERATWCATKKALLVGRTQKVDTASCSITRENCVAL
jgi:hypothetical protein